MWYMTIVIASITSITSITKNIFINPCIIIGNFHKCWYYTDVCGNHQLAKYSPYVYVCLLHI